MIRNELDWYMRTLELIRRERARRCRNPEDTQTTEGSSHLQLDPRNRHNDHTTQRAPSSSAVTVATGGTDNASGEYVATCDPVASFLDLEASGPGRGAAHDHQLRRTTDELQTVSRLDQPSLAEQAASSTEAQTTNNHRARRVVALHPPWRRSLGRRWLPVLRRAANDRRMVRRTWTPRVVGSAGGSDGSCGTSVQGEPLLHRVARGEVAEHVAALSGLPLTGPARVW